MEDGGRNAEEVERLLSFSFDERKAELEAALALEPVRSIAALAWPELDLTSVADIGKVVKRVNGMLRLIERCVNKSLGLYRAASNMLFRIEAWFCWLYGYFCSGTGISVVVRALLW